MQITEQNRERVKKFMQILLELQVDPIMVEAICIMIKEDSQMVLLLNWLKNHLEATEQEIYSKVEEIIGE